jgi:hypothetical protein
LKSECIAGLDAHLRFGQIHGHVAVQRAQEHAEDNTAFAVLHHAHFYVMTVVGIAVVHLMWSTPGLDGRSWEWMGVQVVVHMMVSSNMVGLDSNRMDEMEMQVVELLSFVSKSW